MRRQQTSFFILSKRKGVGKTEKMAINFLHEIADFDTLSPVSNRFPRFYNKSTGRQGLLPRTP
jgi:hypothetical protein